MANSTAAAVVMNGKKRKAAATPAEQDALKVHRCRFLDWMPHAIHSMSFAPTGKQLAVARSNGDVEIWHVDRKWHLRFVVSGSEQSKISAMQWSTSGRLFVASLDGTLWEIDFQLLKKKHVTDSNGGPIWCMEINNATESLAVGCEDGRIRLFSFQDDELYFQKGFITTGRRVVSLAWHTASNKMFSGSEDGLIHCWSAQSGRNESRITLESLAKQKCVVWSLLVLDNLTVVSGDSHGNLSFWNGHTGTLLQKFSHLTADILALAVDQSNSVLFASGVDNQVVEFIRVAGHENNWAYAYSHRAHSHDVRSLALSSGAHPVLVSGGIDTQLVWYRADSFNVHRPSKIASMPYRKSVSLSSEKRILLVQKSTSLDLWRLASTTSGDAAANNNHKLLLEIQVNDSFNIACSALAPNGSFVACSTAKELKLFSLDAASGYRPRKLTLPAAARESARVLAFSPDSTRLVIGTDAHQISVLDLTKLEILKTFHVAPPASAASSENAVVQVPTAILSLSISLDGQWLATGDAANTISIYNLDSMQFYAHLPRPSEMHTSLGFNPSGNTLVVTLVSNSFVCYDVEKKGLSEWYRQHHEHFPKALVDGRNVKGMAFDPAHPNFLYLYSQSSLYQINMGKHDASAKSPSPVKKARGRAMSMGTESDGKQHASEGELVELEDGFCRVINRYRPLSFVDFLDENELLIVETPWLKVLSRLPGALQRHKYGK